MIIMLINLEYKKIKNCSKKIKNLKKPHFQKKIKNLKQVFYIYDLKWDPEGDSLVPSGRGRQSNAAELNYNLVFSEILCMKHGASTDDSSACMHACMQNLNASA